MREKNVEKKKTFTWKYPDLFSHSTFLNSSSLYITPFLHEHSDLNATFSATEHSLKTDLPLKKRVKKKKKLNISLFFGIHTALKMCLTIPSPTTFSSPRVFVEWNGGKMKGVRLLFAVYCPFPSIFRGVVIQAEVGGASYLHTYISGSLRWKGWFRNVVVQIAFWYVIIGNVFLELNFSHCQFRWSSLKKWEKTEEFWFRREGCSDLQNGIWKRT